MRRWAILLLVLAVPFCLLAQEWTVNLAVVGGDLEDTVFVSYGVSATASDGFDSAVDIVFPMAPPSGMYAYFPIDEPEHPGITMLGRDIRSSHDHFVDWEVHVERDFSGEPTIIYWEPEMLPMADVLLSLASTMEIAAQYPGVDIEEWYDMSDTDRIEIGAGMIVYIHAEMASEVSTPPAVTFISPEDGEIDVDPDEPIRFNITNEFTGVDISSLVLVVGGDTISHDLLSIGSIDYGYEIVYDPEESWSFASEIDIVIVASDMSDTPSWMEPFESFFSIIDDVSDTEPPYFELIVGEETGRFDDVYVKVIDESSRVDDGTIELTVEDAVWTDYELTLYEGTPPYYTVTIHPPLYGWETCTTIEISIAACDDNSEPNCSDTTLNFDVICEDFVDWDFNLHIWTALDDDTTGNNLSFGLSDDASSRYDPGVDIAMTLPGFTAYGFFVLDDPYVPYVTQLQKDLKEPASSVTWLIDYNNPRDVCGINWSQHDLIELETILRGRFRIGYGPDSGHMTWNDMRLRSQIIYEPEDNVYIRFSYGTADTVPPYVTNITPHPDSVELGLPGESTIAFDLRDVMNGINPSSFELWINDERISDEYISDALLSDGLHIQYNAPEPFDYGTYDVTVVVCDYNLPVGNCAEITWTYEFIPCIDEFRVEIQVFDRNSSGDTLGRGYIEIGTSPDALVGRDSHDEPTFRPPTGPFFYFPIEDAIYDHLGVDVRPTCGGAQLWRVGAEAIMGGFLNVSWDVEEIPDDPRWTVGIASAPIGSGLPEDSDYMDMSSITNFSYTGGEICYIKTLDMPTYCVTGVVTAEMADESTMVNVTLVERRETISVASGDTFQFCGVMDGIYNFDFSADGYYSHTLPDIVVDGADVALCPINLNLQLANIEGMIDLDGHPTDEALVTIDDISIAADSGYYRIEGLYPGTVTVCVSELPECYSDTCVEVTLVAGENVLDIAMEQPLYTLTGSIQYDGSPVEGAEIMFCESSEVLTTTDADGNYSIANMSCGEYCIHVEISEDIYVDTIVSIYSDMTLDIDIPSMFFSISGSVDVICGWPVEDIRAVLTDSVGGMIETGADSMGYFVFTALTAGEYCLQINGLYMADYFDTLMIVDTDLDLDIEMLCLLPVTYFGVEGQEVERPFEPGDMNITLTWTAPSSALDISGFKVYRADSVFAEPYMAEMIAELPAEATEYRDTDVEPFVEYYYGIVVVYGASPFNSPLSPVGSDMAEEHPDQSTILIVDLDDSALPLDGYGAEYGLTEILDNPALDFTGEYTVTSQNPASFDGYQLSDYNAIFIVLGIDDASNPVVPESMVEDLITYSVDNPGGMIYMEGPDIGKLNRSAGGVHRDFIESFGIRWIPGYDGVPETEGNVQTLTMKASFFGEEFTGDYPYRGLPDRSVDYFTLITAQEVMRSQDGNIRGAMRMLDSDVKLIASSIYLGAINDMATKVRIMGRYLEIDAVSETPLLPTERAMIDVTPNPFNSSASVTYDVEEAGTVTLSLMSSDGRLVRVLYSGIAEKGEYTLTVDASNIPTGSYLVVLESDGKISSAKAILVK